MITRYALVLASLFLADPALAADSPAKQEKVARIIEAQGLHQMFQTQLDQGLASAQEVGRTVVRRIAQETGMSDAEASSKLEPVFRRYMERCATIFSARELVEMWAQAYGRDLSESELDQIHAFYISPAGRKDVAASHAAMASFGERLNSISQERLNESLGQLMHELKDAASE